VFVSWSPASLLASKHAASSAAAAAAPTMLCCISVLPSEAGDHSGADADAEVGAVLDFRKMRGDFVAFHEFFMRFAHLISLA
jgi:hypothetical protein